VALHNIALLLAYLIVEALESSLASFLVLLKTVSARDYQTAATLKKLLLLKNLTSDKSVQYFFSHVITLKIKVDTL